MTKRNKGDTVLVCDAPAKRDRTKKEQAAFVRFMSRLEKQYGHLRAAGRAHPLDEVAPSGRARSSEGDY